MTPEHGAPLAEERESRGRAVHEREGLCPVCVLGSIPNKPSWTELYEHSRERHRDYAMAHVTPEPNVRNVPELLVELEAKTRSFISQLAQRRTFWLRRIGEMTDDSLGQWVRQGNLAEVESIIEQAGDLRSLLDELDKAKVAMGMPLGSELAKKRGPR